MRTLLAIAGMAYVCVLSAAQQPAPAGSIVLRKDQLLSLRLVQQMSSADSKTDDKVDLELESDLVVDGRLIARKGARSHALVADANHVRALGPPAWLTLRIEDLELAEGETLQLKSKFDVSGNTMGVLAWDAALGLSPAAALLLHGKNVVLPKGTVLPSRVAKDTTLDGTKFAAVGDADADTAAPRDSKSESLAINTSTGDGSVTLDGQYVGEAPLSLQVNRGGHVVEVRCAKQYRVWKNRVVVQGEGLELRVDMVTKAKKAKS